MRPEISMQDGWPRFSLMQNQPLGDNEDASRLHATPLLGSKRRQTLGPLWKCDADIQAKDQIGVQRRGGECNLPVRYAMRTSGTRNMIHRSSERKARRAAGNARERWLATLSFLESRVSLMRNQWLGNDDNASAPHTGPTLARKEIGKC